MIRSAPTGRRFGAVAAALAFLLVVLTACVDDDKRPLDVVAHDGIVFVAVAHANAPAPDIPVAFRDLITASIAAAAPVTVVSLDGTPEVSFRAAGYEISDENPDATDVDIRRIESRLLTAVRDAAPDSDGNDLGAALAVAADQLRADGATSGAIVVVDNGISDRGFPDMTADGASLATPASVVEFAQAHDELWSMPAGTTVYLAGIGYVSAPQDALPPRQRENILDIWSALVSASGAKAVAVTTPRGGESTSSSFSTGLLAPAETAPFTVQTTGGSVRADLAGDVLFDFDSHALRPDATPALARLLEVVATTPGHVTVIGHTDDVGSAEENVALAERRAASVAAWLIANGIDPSRISTVGKGEAEPVTAGTSEEDRAANRRVVVEIAPER
ncbi:OmpA family protein [Microbacterium sp. 10M-3C3]|jgi:outer membrane protein OmpA-like peptidoglycan-associated protein|uniref:OmpA family protein n=1 Tax=Microbacterium sp. 10M-3C3 TaxID=2483401 RepID=UPI000F635328|nr:OmpA family protein [Microbacterium sp. 10M-3C3]